MTPAEAPPLANLEAEAALLGALMIDNRLLDSVSDIITAADFGEPLHGRIFGCITSQVLNGRAATPVTLKLLLAADPALMDMGGPAYLAGLTAQSGALLAARDFAEHIRDLAKMRRLRDALTATIARIADTSLDLPPEFFADEIEAAAWDASGQREGVKEVSFGGAIQSAIDRAAEVAASGQKPGFTCSTISDINNITGGLEAGHFVILGARPGVGKTACATSWAYGLARNGHGVGFISLEMGDIDLGMRMAADVTHDIAHRTGDCRAVPHEAIRNARLTPEDARWLEMARAEVESLPLLLVDAASMTLSRIAAQVRRWKRKMKAQGRELNVVLIDYLQLIRGSGKKDQNRTQEIGEISRGLKQLAKAEGICIVALAQLSRQVEQRDNKRPVLSDLRDSGEIEQDADIVIFLYRDEYYLRLSKPEGDAAKEASWQTRLEQAEGKIEFIPGKQRHGAPKTHTGFFFGANQAVRGGDFYQQKLEGRYR